MTKAAYPTIGIAAFVMFVIVYFIGWLRYGGKVVRFDNTVEGRNFEFVAR